LNIPTLKTEILSIQSVSRTTKGGDRSRFVVISAHSDGANRIALMRSKAKYPVEAIKKNEKQAPYHMISIALDKNHSILCDINIKYKSSKLILKRAKAGTGLVVPQGLRPIFELLGIENVTCKSYMSKNLYNQARGLLENLSRISENHTFLDFMRRRSYKMEPRTHIIESKININRMNNPEEEIKIIDN
jgi:small subunit ribosomal protein S5